MPIYDWRDTLATAIADVYDSANHLLKVGLQAGTALFGKVQIRNSTDSADIDPLAEGTFTGRMGALTDAPNYNPASTTATVLSVLKGILGGAGATRSTGTLHRDAVAAIDKVTPFANTDLTTADVTSGGALEDSTTYKVTVVPATRWGPCSVPAVINSQATGADHPNHAHSVRVTIPQATGAEYYSLFLSTDAAPKHVARITEAQRAAGVRITAIGTAAGDNAAAVAGKIRTALGADPDVSAFFTISGAGADIILTAKTKAANDGTMNCATANGTCAGVTPAASSANTTAGIAPVTQQETATIVGTVTGDGNAKITVTANGMGSSPKDIAVAVLNGDDASAVAGKARTALGLDADVVAFFTVGGTGADILLTAKTAAADDGTMNIASDNWTCTGLTTQASSANTRAGVAGQLQVETATVVADITTSGNVAVTVTANGMGSSPKTINVAVLATGLPSAGNVDICVVGTGQASNAQNFAQNNAYRPDNAGITAFSCVGRKRVHVLAKLALTDLRTAPSLSLVPFFANQLSSGDWAQGQALTVGLLNAVGQSQIQDFYIDVDGSTGLKILVGTIAGQGAACSIWVE